LKSSMHGNLLILVELILLHIKTAKLFAIQSCNSGYIAIPVLHVVYILCDTVAGMSKYH
jgi:hypothetical protein